MEPLRWFDRKFTFNLPFRMLPFYLERLDGTISRIEKKVEGIAEDVLSNRLDNKWSVKDLYNLSQLMRLKLGVWIFATKAQRP